MSPFFIVAFIFVFVLSLGMDRTLMKGRGAFDKTIYYTIAVLTVALFVGGIFNLHYPMPTSPFTSHIGPWIHDTLKH